jgi:hypothetical protein
MAGLFVMMAASVLKRESFGKRPVAAFHAPTATSDRPT